MMIRRLLLVILLLVLHLIDLLRLLIGLTLCLPPGRFLILLRKIARLATACAHAVFAAVSLQMIFCADIPARDHGKDE